MTFSKCHTIRLAGNCSISTVKSSQARANEYLNLVRGASHSSHSWLERQKKDVYTKMRRYHDYRARSAFKLIEIDDKFKFLGPGKVVIDAGAAPGSWTQVVCERLKLADKRHAKNGMCLAVDLAAIVPIEGAVCLGNADFTSPFTQGKILTWLDGRKADCVISDMAPKASGQKSYDHERIIKLVRSLVPFTFAVLKPHRGIFLFKIWDGLESDELIEDLSKHFEIINKVKPDASRDDSSELFFLCQGFKGAETA